MGADLVEFGFGVAAAGDLGEGGQDPKRTLGDLAPAQALRPPLPRAGSAQRFLSVYGLVHNTSLDAPSGGRCHVVERRRDELHIG
jgi:hypothetical protein